MSLYEKQMKADEERSGDLKMSGIFDITAGKLLLPSLSGSAIGSMVDHEFTVMGGSGSAGLFFKVDGTLYRVNGTVVE